MDAGGGVGVVCKEACEKPVETRLMVGAENGHTAQPCPINSIHSNSSHPTLSTFKSTRPIKFFKSFHQDLKLKLKSIYKRLIHHIYHLTKFPKQILKSHIYIYICVCVCVCVRERDRNCCCLSIKLRINYYYNYY